MIDQSDCPANPTSARGHSNAPRAWPRVSSHGQWTMSFSPCGVQSFYLNRGKLGKNVSDGTIPYRRDAVLSHDAEWFHFWVRAKTPKRWNSSIYFGSVHYGIPEKWAKWTNFEYNQVGYIFFLGLKTFPEVFKYTRSPSPSYKATAITNIYQMPWKHSESEK